MLAIYSSNSFREWLLSLDTGLGHAERETKVQRHIRALAKPLRLPDGFPDKRVSECFLNPNVDRSKNPFSWARPDFAGIELFLAEKARCVLREVSF
jgi:DNA excision repair protein ERCC-5